MTVHAHWLAFYADRFIKETSQLNPFEVAVYYRLFESYAQTGHLVDDLFILGDIAKLNSAMPVFQALTGARPDRAMWAEFIDATINGLLTRFFELASDGTYHHRGWDAELGKAKLKYEARAKGGRSRWDKAATTDQIESQTGNGNDNQTDNQTGTDNYNENIQNHNAEQTTRTRTRTSEHSAQLS